MPYYKILGIYTFINNIRDMNINDPVILKLDSFNIKSKNAIGVYSLSNKKLGYLPIEDKDEINKFNKEYKVSKIRLCTNEPIFEISRNYPLISYINIIDALPFTSYNKDLLLAVDRLKKHLQTKKIKVLNIIVTHYDDNYINILIETKKGTQTFKTVTYEYYKRNVDKYEEFEEYGLIDNSFYRELLTYRLECYIEANYNNIIDIPKLENNIIYDVKEDYNVEESNEDIDIVKKNIREDIKEKYKLEKGKMYYDHENKIYSNIDFISDNKYPFIVCDSINKNYIINKKLMNTDTIYMYNVVKGIIYRV